MYMTHIGSTKLSIFSDIENGLKEDSKRLRSVRLNDRVFTSQNYPVYLAMCGIFDNDIYVGHFIGDYW